MWILYKLFMLVFFLGFVIMLISTQFWSWYKLKRFLNQCAKYCFFFGRTLLNIVNIKYKESKTTIHIFLAPQDLFNLLMKIGGLGFNFIFFFSFFSYLYLIFFAPQDNIWGFPIFDFISFCFLPNKNLLNKKDICTLDSQDFVRLVFFLLLSFVSYWLGSD